MVVFMSEFTTIRIKKETREKIDKLRGNITTSDYLEDIINEIGGVKIDDVTEIKRDAIAEVLDFVDYNNPANNRRYAICFQELKSSRVRDVYTAERNPTSQHYMNMEAEVLFKDDISVVLRVIESAVDGSTKLINTRLVHIDLF